jgi:uncharacterized protein YeeX (DUF496 family)
MTDTAAMAWFELARNVEKEMQRAQKLIHEIEHHVRDASKQVKLLRELRQTRPKAPPLQQEKQPGPTVFDLL